MFPPIEMFPGGICAHGLEFSWWFTLFEFLLVIQVLKVLPIVSNDISRSRDGGHWSPDLPAAWRTIVDTWNTLAFYNLWVLMFVYLNNFIWKVCGLCCTHKKKFIWLYVLIFLVTVLTVMIMTVISVKYDFIMFLCRFWFFVSKTYFLFNVSEM